MIRTDGRPTIAWAREIPGQVTLEEAIALAENEKSCEELLVESDRRIAKLREQVHDWPPAEPAYGGHN